VWRGCSSCSLLLGRNYRTLKPKKTFKENLGVFEPWLCVSACIAQSVNTETCHYQLSYNVSATSARDNEGYISSQSVTELPAACDRDDRPWVITAQHGQRINLTLLNFTPLRPNQLNSLTPHHGIDAALSQHGRSAFSLHSDSKNCATVHSS